MVRARSLLLFIFHFSFFAEYFSWNWFSPPVVLADRRSPCCPRKPMMSPTRSYKWGPAPYLEFSFPSALFPLSSSSCLLSFAPSPPLLPSPRTAARDSFRAGRSPNGRAGCYFSFLDWQVLSENPSMSIRPISIANPSSKAKASLASKPSWLSVPATHKGGGLFWNWILRHIWRSYLISLCFSFFLHHGRF